MAFSDQLSSFHDELTAIVDDMKKKREADMDQRNERPYQSLLTQDEEPSQDYNPQQAEEAEPEVITRGSA